jgi:glucose-6-phosphate isomerase
MKLQHINPTETKAWQKLTSHFSEIEKQSIQDLFQNDAKRAEKFKIEWNDFYVDFSKNNWTEETKQLLTELANEVGLPDAISSYFSGEKINETEDRAVLHTALRANESDVVAFEGENVIPEIFTTKNKIKDFTNYIVSGEAKGYS